MTLVAETVERIGGQVPALTGRVEEVADLTALVREGALPPHSPACFVVSLGFDAQKADAVTGMFRQTLNDVIGVVLVVQALGDPKARRAQGTIDELKKDLLAKLAGWKPASAIGVFEPRRGRLVSVTQGAVIYQIEFGLNTQLRITT
jgi:hypothetical protein